ncbi:hypothetical protein [Pedobacter steynii]|nr:hypothetical protein [Pedobacter steynii]
MNNPQKIFIGYESTDKNKAEEYLSRSETRFLIFENIKSGSIVNGCYMSILNTGIQNNIKSVRYKEPGNLTGNIIYFNPDGTMANGWAFRDGATLQRFSVSNEREYKATMRIRSEEDRINKSNGGKIARYEAAYCTPEYRIIYGMACAGADGYMNCQQYVIGREYINNCTYGGGGGADGEYTPPNPTGGGTGSTPPTKDIIDSLQGYPCAQALLTQLPLLNNDIAAKINATFNGSCDFNMKFVPHAFPAGSKTDGDQTVTSIEMKNGFNVKDGFTISTTIRINEDVLKYATKEYILATMYHEALHSFIAVEKFRLGDQYSTTYPDVNPAYINGAAGIDVTKAIFVDKHSVMAINYLNGLTSALLSYNSNLNKATAEAMAAAGILHLDPAASTLNTNERDTRNKTSTGTKCP